MLSDLRYALRSLRRAPATTAAAVISLTLGIAASTTIFSLVDAAMFRPPPFAEADRLMVLTAERRSPADGVSRMRWSWPQFQLLEPSLVSFDALASTSSVVVTLTGVADPEPLPIEVVSSDYLRVTRAPLRLGAGLDAGHESGRPAAVIGYELWQRRYGGRADALGGTVELNGVPLTVAGVADRGFAGISGRAQAWIPARAAPVVSYPGYLTTPQNFITVVGRLRDGVPPDRARAELAVAGERVQLSEPTDAEGPDDQFSATLVPFNEARTDRRTRRALTLLAGAAGILLLIACANVTGLLLGRAVERRREIAIRLAIGASRWRLVRQLLVESSALAAVSGVLAVGVAAWAAAAARVPATLARGRTFFGDVGEFAAPHPDWRMLAFAVAVAAVTVVAAGLLPALQSARADVVRALKSGGHASRGRRPGVREAVVALQVALVLVLVAACGLFVASYARLRGEPLGFDAERLLTFVVRPAEARYPPAAAPALLDRMLDEIARVPGVEAATVDGCSPLGTDCATASLRIVGRPSASGADAPIVRRHYVGPDHFRALGIPLLRGRPLRPSDRAGSAPVVVINQAAADRFWPGEDPIGRRIWFEGAASLPSPEESAEIVGVVANVAYDPIDETPIRADFFTPYAQFTYAGRMVLVRTAGDPMALLSPVAQAVRRADPGLALFDVQSMTDRAGQSWAKRRVEMLLLMVMAAMALCLAVTGVHGVTAHFVAARTRDIGIRLALGAPRRRIVTAALSQTLRLAAAGVALGTLGALGVGQALRSSLYETSPLSPAVYAAAAAVLVAAVAVASYVPLRRALRVDPIESLRAE